MGTRINGAQYLILGERLHTLMQSKGRCIGFIVVVTVSSHLLGELDEIESEFFLQNAT